MGNIYLGDKAPKSVYWGSSPVKIYYGSTLIWTAEISWTLDESNITSSQIASFINAGGGSGSYKIVRINDDRYNLYHTTETGLDVTGYTQYFAMNGTISEFGPDNIVSVISDSAPHAIIFQITTAPAGTIHYDTTYPTWTEKTVYAEIPPEAIDEAMYSACFGSSGSSSIAQLFYYVADKYATGAGAVYAPTDDNDWPYKTPDDNWYRAQASTTYTSSQFLEAGTPIYDFYTNNACIWFVIWYDGTKITLYRY